MTTKRKPTKSAKPTPISIRVNGKPVANAAGAKLAAERIGCVQTRGEQCGQGSVLQMVEAIGAGRVAQFVVDIDSPELVEAVAADIEYLVRGSGVIPETLRATAAALRNAARLREASEK